MLFFKLLGVALLIVIGILIIGWVKHKKSLAQEADHYPPPGKVVQVNGQRIHVYAEGNGEHTCVFMAGHGTAAPTIDFKPLWRRMIPGFRIAVVERPGYGWSHSSDCSRDISQVLEETRHALERAGESGPFVLIPHSMAGLEAIYWTQLYPHEIHAVIGLDPCTPKAVSILPIEQKGMLTWMHRFVKTGLIRWVPDAELRKRFPLAEEGRISKEDMDQYMACFYRNGFSKDMIREIDDMPSNAKKVEAGKVPANTPMLFFVSTEQENAVPGWGQTMEDFLQQLKTGDSIVLDTSHYIHYDKAETIAEEAHKFLVDIKKSISSQGS